MKKVKVINRSSGPVGYSIPEINLSRVFAAGEDKDIPVDELQKLAYQAGGQELIDMYFLIKDEETANEFSPLVAKELEYNYTKEDVINLVKFGSLDEFLDALDFAPEGVVELIKAVSIELPLTDTQKMQAFKDKRGTDLANLIKINEEAKAEKAIETKVTQRRVAASTPVTEEAPKRRVTTEYNVINRK